MSRGGAESLCRSGVRARTSRHPSCETRMFSSFRSRCTMPSECRYSIGSSTCAWCAGAAGHGERPWAGAVGAERGGLAGLAKASRALALRCGGGMRQRCSGASARRVPLGWGDGAGASGGHARLRDEDARVGVAKLLLLVQLVEEVAARAELHDENEVARRDDGAVLVGDERVRDGREEARLLHDVLHLLVRGAAGGGMSSGWWVRLFVGGGACVRSGAALGRRVGGAGWA